MTPDVAETVQPDKSLASTEDGFYISWDTDGTEIYLDGYFTLADLCSIVKHIKKYQTNSQVIKESGDVP